MASDALSVEMDEYLRFKMLGVSRKILEDLRRSSNSDYVRLKRIYPEVPLTQALAAFMGVFTFLRWGGQ